MTRRTFIRSVPAVSALGVLPAPAAGPSPGAPARAGAADVAARPGRDGRVVVVGAGAFGGWTALHLLRRGARVTLLDAWGPGNARASSGGRRA